MFGSRSRWIPVMAGKYFTKKWVAGDSKKDSVPLLDIYKDYRGWIADNAQGCELEVADFAKKITELFQNASIKDGVVHGLAHYVEPPKPAPQPKPTKLEKDIEYLLSKTFYEHKNLEHKFTPKEILDWWYYDSMGISEQQLIDYLEKSDQYFKNEKKNYWVKEWQG